MKLGIIGSRTFEDLEKAKKVFNSMLKKYTKTIVSGGAIGADQIGAIIAAENDIEYLEHRPDWKKHGKKAGFVRNELIINDSDIILAFWDGKSKGTANSLNHAKKQKKPCIIVYF